MVACGGKRKFYLFMKFAHIDTNLINYLQKKNCFTLQLRIVLPAHLLLSSIFISIPSKNWNLSRKEKFEIINYYLYDTK